MLAAALVPDAGAQTVQAQPTPSSSPSGRTLEAEIAAKIPGSFTVAAVGDILMPQPLDRHDPGFRSIMDRVRAADVAFGNLESALVDFNSHPGPFSGTMGPLETGDAVKAMGFDLLNTATNHTFDGGLAGMFATNEHLDKLGIVHAGTGRDLQEARAARYLETPHGRVGLIGMFSVDDVSFIGPRFNKTEATYRNGFIGGAPGVNALHLTNYHVVSPEELDALKAIARNAYGSRPGDTPPSREGVPDRFKFFDEWYEAGADVGALHYDINPEDERDILRAVRNGKVYSDFLIVTIHAHQATEFRHQGAGGTDHEAPDFLIRLARSSIDNGADMFVAHGVHALHAIEIYKGRPIFYGLSNFIFQTGLGIGRSDDVIANNQAAMENEASQDGLLTTTRFEDGQLAEIRLYPVELGGAQRPISRMGVPTVPTRQEAERILRDLQSYSDPFGTTITIEDGVGVIRIPPLRK